MLELGLESNYKNTINKKTKTKNEKYLNDKVLNIQILPDDYVRLNVIKICVNILKLVLRLSKSAEL